VTALSDGNPAAALENMKKASVFGSPPMEAVIEVRAWLTKIW